MCHEGILWVYTEGERGVGCATAPQRGDGRGRRDPIPTLRQALWYSRCSLPKAEIVELFIEVQAFSQSYALHLAPPSLPLLSVGSTGDIQED